MAGAVSCIGSGGAVFVAEALCSGTATRQAAKEHITEITCVRDAERMRVQNARNDFRMSIVLLRCLKIPRLSLQAVDVLGSKEPEISVVSEKGDQQKKFLVRS